jgi:acyl transferase domain-containing protein
VIVGVACRVPGADSVTEFAELLFNGRTGYGQLPPDRCDRDLYFDAQKPESHIRLWEELFQSVR